MIQVAVVAEVSPGRESQNFNGANQEQVKKYTWLVGGWAAQLKNIRQYGNLPQRMVNLNKNFETTS